jgi:tetratricopeptide (TPR) repeat protein
VALTGEAEGRRSRWLRAGRVEWLSGALLVGAFHALGAFPLVAGPGYEAALVLGLLLPVPVAVLSAVWAARRLRNTAVASPGELLWRPLGFGGAVFLACALDSIARGWVAGFCDLGQGCLYLLLGPGAGALLAAAWGVLCAVLLGARRRVVVAAVLAALGPLGTALFSVWRFWSSPMIFAFDPFVGYFAGTPYDTVIEAVAPLLRYRLGSCLELSALALLLCARRSSSVPRWEPVALSAGLVLGAGALLHQLFGPELGFYQTSATIREALGGRLERGACEIVYARGIGLDRAELLARECEAQLSRIGAYYGFQPQRRITAFVFANAAQKAQLMGAANTEIAKPWRSEIYIQGEGYPHPVLGHELVHAALGELGPGPWHVPGPWGGLIPDPGRVEGFAVAGSPRDDTDYTLFEWSRALLELGSLPNARSLFRLGFLGQNSSKAYVVAGAMVEYLHERYGAARLGQWYAGGTLQTLDPGLSWSQLDLDFRARLASVPLDPAAIELARARFERPAVFGRHCPHQVDRLLDEANQALGSQSLDLAREAFAAVLGLEPRQFQAQLGLARCERARGALGTEREMLENLLAAPGALKAQRAVLQERLGDLALLTGDTSVAQTAFAAARSYAGGENAQRNLDVKVFAADHSGISRDAIVGFLVGDTRGQSDVLEAGALLGRFAAIEPELGLADYLIGKNLYNRGRFAAAASALDRALSKLLPPARVEREALRTRLLAACALGQTAEVRELTQRYLAFPGLSRARRDEGERLRASCGN